MGIKILDGSKPWLHIRTIHAPHWVGSVGCLSGIPPLDKADSSFRGPFNGIQVWGSVTQRL